MRSLFIVSKSQALPDQLTFRHYCELLSLSDMSAFSYYINLAIKQNFSYRTLREKIKSNEYVIKYCSDNRIIARVYELV